MNIQIEREGIQAADPMAEFFELRASAADAFVRAEPRAHQALHTLPADAWDEWKSIRDVE